MKSGRRRRRTARGDGPPEAAWDGFVKGFASTGLLAALRDGQDHRRVLRLALQGGTALAAASAAARALNRGSAVTALASLAAGAVGLCLLQPEPAADTPDADTSHTPD